MTSESVIATGFPERTDPAALVVGPTGVALGEDGTLYVADTQGNRIAAVPARAVPHDAIGEGGGTTVAKGGYLNSPLGLTLAPNGDILTANAADGNLVETTPVGAEFQPFDTGAGEGGLFGLVVTPSLKGVYMVDDANNTLALAQLATPPGGSRRSRVSCPRSTAAGARAHRGPYLLGCRMRRAAARPAAR